MTLHVVVSTVEYNLFKTMMHGYSILVCGWTGGKHACVDLTGVSPLVGLRSGNFIVGQWALKAASSKVAKHEKACSDNQ
ncbi:auxilin-like protein, partial [Trifolium medium]|nr:auxilin-like protein [Trifolium medium]